MNLKVPGAILPLCYAILSTRAKTVRGLLQPPLGELGLNQKRLQKKADKTYKNRYTCITGFYFNH